MGLAGLTLGRISAQTFKHGALTESEWGAAEMPVAPY